MDSGGIISLNLDYIFGKFYDFLRWIWDGFFDGSLGRAVAYILGLISVALLFVIFYTMIRMNEIEAEDGKKKKEKFYPVESAPVVAPRHEKWEVVKSHMFSNNQAEWRLAIIEADTILDELTVHIGLIGMTLADRLKGARQADFTTIQSAWEAHKVQIGRASCRERV